MAEGGQDQELLVDFLRGRHISESVIKHLQDDKIDTTVIDVMSDEELARYIISYGDRLALRAFSRQQAMRTPRGDMTKSTLMQRVRDRLSERRKRPTNKDAPTAEAHCRGNKFATKETRRVEIGWLHFSLEDDTFHQVRTRNGGGTRSLTVQKCVRMVELLETGKSLFFPNGRSSKGPIENFNFDIRDYSHNILESDITVGQLYEETKLRMVRIYTTTKAKNHLERSDSSDAEASNEMQRGETTSQSRPETTTISNTEVLHPPSSSDVGSHTLQTTDCLMFMSTEESDQVLSYESETTTISNTEVLHPPPSSDVGSHTLQTTDCLMYMSTQESDQVLSYESDMAFAIKASLEDFEVQFGPASGHDGGDQDTTLPWNPHSLNSIQHSTLNDGSVPSSSLPASPDPNEKELLLVTLRRVNIVEDMLNLFMKPKVLNADLKIEFANEKAVDSDGVSREAYSAFWEHFLEQCEGEDERVPRLRPDYCERKWQALGRLWLKGYQDHNIIPIRLSPAFILACCQGLDSVDEELLMVSFARFLSENERASLEKALQGNTDETVEEDLMDIFSRMGSHCVPPKDSLRAAILTIAHKALLQEPKFIIDCFHSSIHNVPALKTKNSVMELYESKRPTNKKVAQMIKPSCESLTSQEQTALNHLLRYVRSLDQRKLETFLRFCTGSTVLCKNTIELTFNKLSGLSRRPVAHTCGAVLELPCTYSSYPEFRQEFDNVLCGDCFTMDIV